MESQTPRCRCERGNALIWIDGEQQAADVYHRQDAATMLYRPNGPSATIQLASLGIQIPIDIFYRHIVFTMNDSEEA